MKGARAIKEEAEQQFLAGAGLLADLRLELRSSREREKELLLQLQRAQERLRQFEELEKEAIDREEEACCGICGEDCVEEEEHDALEESDIVEKFAALAALIQRPASVDGFCSLLGEYARCDATGAPPFASGPGAAEEGATHGEVYSCYGGCGARAHMARIWAGCSKHARRGLVYGSGWALCGPGVWLVGSYCFWGRSIGATSATVAGAVRGHLDRGAHTRGATSTEVARALVLGGSCRFRRRSFGATSTVGRRGSRPPRPQRVYVRGHQDRGGMRAQMLGAPCWASLLLVYGYPSRRRTVQTPLSPRRISLMP